MDLLEQHASIIRPDVRRDLCRSVMLMRTKETVQAARYGRMRIMAFVKRGWLTVTGIHSAFALFFKLFRVKDKALREMLYQHIVSDIRRMNQRTKNNSINKTLQNFMFTMVQDDDATAAHMSIKVMVELYRKGAWYVDTPRAWLWRPCLTYAHARSLCRKDARTCNVMAMACFSPHTKVMVAALQFFLGADDLEDNDDSDEVCCCRQETLAMQFLSLPSVLCLLF